MFLVEATGDRVPCLLNPESIVARRRAGVRARPVPIGAAVADEPLACDGGGASEWQLDLLFDVDLAGEGIVDVRQLTAPLARLAENAWDDQRPRAPRVRLIW